MKKTTTILSLIGLLLFSNCADMGLKEELYSSYSASNFYSTPSQLVTQAWSIYDFDHCYFEMYMFPLTEMQFKYFSKKGGDPSLYNMLPSNANFTIWSFFYTCIDRANVQIKYAPRVKISQNIIDMYIADAKFMRAWSYYNLTRLFGEVPLYSIPTENASQETIYKAPSSVDDVYKLIVEDLQFASLKLPAISWPIDPKTDQGRVCQPAARTLLAEVYLTMAGNPLKKGQPYYQLAYDQAKALIDDVDANKYTNVGLLTDWASIFSVDNELNKEILYSMKKSRNDLSGSVAPFSAAPAHSGGVFTAKLANDGAYAWTYDVSFLDLFEKTDQRYLKGFVWSYTNSKGVFVQFDNDPSSSRTDGMNYNSTNGICMVKYQDKYATRNVVQAKDNIIIRYVDAFLIAAEAAVELNKLDEAKAYIKVVRDRVQATPFNSDDQSVLRQQIRDERLRELFGEFTTTYDLRRWGTAKDNFENHPYKIKGNGATLLWNDKFVEYSYPANESSLNPQLTPNW